jgi:hypothetical protein
MRRRLALPVLAVAAGTLAAGLAATPAAAQRPTDKAAVDSSFRALYQRFLDGLKHRDTTAYRDLLTPNYVHIAGDTAVVRTGRSERLRWDLAQDDQIRVFEVRRCDMQAYGDAAVGPCWYRQVTVSGGKEWDQLGVSMVTFVRGTDRRWRIAATRPSLARDVAQ